MSMASSMDNGLQSKVSPVLSVVYVAFLKNNSYFSNPPPRVTKGWIEIHSTY